MLFDRIASLFGMDIAIDLGTANTLIFVKGKGVVLNEPSVVAVREEGRGIRRVLAVGKEAKEMLGRTPDSIKAIRPMKDGVIADFETTQAMLRYFIKKVEHRRSFVRPRIIVCVPFGITEVEKRAVREASESAGAREVYLVVEPMSAAIGAGLPVMDAGGNMIVDIGGGTTEVAIISLGGIVFSKSIRMAGDKMDEAIINYVKKKYNLLIGERTAEFIKINIGNAIEDGNIQSIKVRGNDLVAGIPRTMEVDSIDVLEAISEPLRGISDSIRVVLEKSPPELSGDIVDRGIVLSGGGALLKNLDRRLREEVRLPVFVAENPLATVVLGSGKIIQDEELLARVTIP